MEERQLRSAAMGWEVFDPLRLSYEAVPDQGIKDAFVLLGLWTGIKELDDLESSVRLLAAALFSASVDPVWQAKEALEELSRRSLTKLEQDRAGNGAGNKAKIVRVVVHDLFVDLATEISNGGKEKVDMESQRFFNWVIQDDVATLAGAPRWEHLIMVGERGKGFKLPPNLLNLGTSLKSVLLRNFKIVHVAQQFLGLDKCQVLIFDACDIEVWDSTPLASRLRRRGNFCMPQLRHLRSSSIRELLSLEKLAALKSLDLAFCDNLTHLRGLSQLTELEYLNLHGCCQLLHLPDLQGLTALRYLELAGCTRFSGLPDLQCLAALTHVDLAGCTALETVSLANCRSLTKLPSLRGLRSLRYLDIRSTGITEIAYLPKGCYVEGMWLDLVPVLILLASS
jgi:hypothetical protein